MTEVKTRKKLIEVALPLDAINSASAREKAIRHGHPSTLHLWWARRPLAAARAVIFAQMVDDKLTLLTEETLEPAAVTAELARASFVEAEKLPNGTEAENDRREAALARARALGRLARDVN